MIASATTACRHPSDLVAGVAIVGPRSLPSIAHDAVMQRREIITPVLLSV